MSTALDEWIEPSNDQGRTPEPPEIVEQWRERMKAWFGNPKRPR